MIQETDAYTAFVEKFKAKKTTDDCYTPPNVYEAVAGFVEKEYRVARSRFVRPFYPCGDYQRFTYAEDCVVVDNPPFSILSQILRFYDAQKIKYFLFAPSLTTFSAIRGKMATAICTNVSIIYENGANVSTSFVTNMERGIIARSAPELYSAVSSAVDENRRKTVKELPKHEYDDHVILAHKIGQFSRYGIEFAVPRSDGVVIGEIEKQKVTGKSIFGAGLLVSDQVVIEREKAEREKAEREKAEREKAEREKAERWELSPKELSIIRSMPLADVQELTLF